MKSSSVKGWKDVFGFTYVQVMKGKANIIVTAIFFVIAVASLPVLSLIQGTDMVKPSDITKINVINTTDIDILPAMENVMADNEKFAEIEYEKVDNVEEESDRISSTDNKSDIMLIFESDKEMGFKAEFKYGEASKLSKEDVEEFAQEFQMKYQAIMAEALDISKEQMEAVNRQVTTDVSMYSLEDLEETPEEESDEMGLEQYSVMLTLITLAVFIVAVSGESVAGAIITEKTSKIVEFLLTSIRPMAIILGKVLAEFAATLSTFGIFAAGLGISFVLNGLINGTFTMKGVPSGIRAVFSGDVLAGLNVPNVILALVLVIIGILVYCMFAGLIGSTVNKIEEMAEGMKLYTFAMLIGCYSGIGIAIACMTGGCPDILKTIACIFPLTAPFTLPGFIILGDIGVVTALISIVCMILTLMVLTLFTANVYEEVVYHNGERLKIKDLIGIYKKNRREASAHE